jgi:two-component system sensor histidine kinase QseC
MHFVRLRWLNSFSRQIMAACTGGVLFGLGLLIAGLFAIVLFQGHILAEAGVSEYAESVGEDLQFDAAGRPVAVGHSQMEWLYNSLGKEVAFRVLDEAGTVVLSSDDGAPALKGRGEPLILEDHTFSLERDGVPMHGATVPIRHEGRTWYVQFASSKRLSEMLHTHIGHPLFSRSVALFCFIALLVYVVVMRFTLRVILKPLNDASAFAAKISPRNLGARLHIAGVPNELRPLVENFNSALDRLEHNYRLQQEFLASAAHELKTPLALIRAQIEVGVDETSRKDLLQDVELMGRQVQQLLHLAEASEPQNYAFATVDAGSLISEVVSYLGRLAHQHGVSVQVSVEAGAMPLRADRGALFTLLKNLLENAIQHCRRGGVVQVRADSTGISVQDDGPGVSAEELPKLFTRFWRGANRRDVGAGLGLPICRQIATVHGWALQAKRGNPGMTFELSINPVDFVRPFRPVA